MAEISFENARISNFVELVTLTLEWVILHTIVHHSSTSTYMLNFIEIEETFCGRTDGRTDVCTYARTDWHLRPALLGRQCRRVDLKTIVWTDPQCQLTSGLNASQTGRKTTSTFSASLVNSTHDKTETSSQR